MEKNISGVEITIEPYSDHFGLPTIYDNLVKCTYEWIVFATSNPSSKTFNFLDLPSAGQNKEMEEKLGPHAFSMQETSLNMVIKRIIVGERITIVAENDPKIDRIIMLEEFILSVRKHLASR